MYASGRCSGSRDDVGSDVGSAISSSAAGGGADTASSDPLPGRGGGGYHGGGGGREFSSPWRRVMDRMKMNGGGRGGRKDCVVARAPFCKRRLSGRENPARPDLSDDEDHQRGATIVAPSPERLGSTIPKNDDAWLVHRDHHLEGAGPGSSSAHVGACGSKNEKIKASPIKASPPSCEVMTTKKKKRKKKKKSGKSKSTSSSSSAPSLTDRHLARERTVTDKHIAESSFVTMNATTSTTTSEINTSSERQYDDPGVDLDLSDESDTDDDIAGNNILSRDIGVIKESKDAQLIIPTNHIASPSQSGSRIYKPKVTTDHNHRTENQNYPRSSPLPPNGLIEQYSYEGIEVVSTSATTPLHGQRTAFATRQSRTIIESESSILGSVQIFAPNNSINGNSPPSVERLTNILKDLNAGENNSFLYHTFGCGGEDEHDDEKNDSFNIEGCHHSVDNNNPPLNQQQVKLKYRSPQRSSTSPNQPASLCGGEIHHHLGSSPTLSSQDSPESRYSSLGGSPASRRSSSNSRATASTLNSGGDRTINTLQSTDGSLIVDNEVREANRRSSRGERIGVSDNAFNSGDGGEANNQEVTVSVDGTDTVFSSSTSSSNYHGYLSSPRPGATMPMDRFFAGGNVAMSPSPPPSAETNFYRTSAGEGEGADVQASSLLAPSISKFFCPKKDFLRGNTRDGTRSPHTVSSNSVSANSSDSGSEMKKPLQFVAYQIREEMESPFDEPPVATTHASSPLIKPRISKVGGGNSQQQQHRPPMVQRQSMSVMQKPPQSPRKQDTNIAHGRSRTPTRTPPPLSYNNAMPSSGANTPSSPPVIVDGPSNAVALCGGDSSMKPSRPYVLRRSADLSVDNSGRGRMILVHPASSYRSQRHVTAISPSEESRRVELSGNTDNLARSTVHTTSRYGNLDTVEEMAAITMTTDTTAVISPLYNMTKRLHIIAPKPEVEVVLGENAAIVSPENKI
jgi:hypothetical protein